MEVSGKAGISNFEITSSHHDVGLSGEFSASLDGKRRDGSIQNAQVHFLNTMVRAHGTIGSEPEPQQRKRVVLDLSTPQARVEDLLRLVVKADRAPLYGNITFGARVILPSGREEFLRRVRLRENSTSLKLTSRARPLSRSSMS